MKRLLLIAAALLALASSASAAEKWEYSCRQGHISKWFSDAELAGFGWQRETGRTIIIEENEIEDFKKVFQEMKKCEALQKCLGDRQAGKVKKCYYNDRRWR